MRQLAKRLQDTLDSQQPIWSQRLDTDSIEVAMDTTLAAAWSSYHSAAPCLTSSLDHPTVCEGRTLLCYAQDFLNNNSSTARRHPRLP